MTLMTVMIVMSKKLDTSGVALMKVMMMMMMMMIRSGSLMRMIP